MAAYTEDLCTSGTASSLLSYPGRPASRAFDDSNTFYLTDAWLSGSPAETGPSVPNWLKYDFGDSSKKTIERYTIAATSRTGYTPKEWAFEGSNDNNQWDILDSQNFELEDFVAFEKKVFDITNTTSYRYYRINITEPNGGQVEIGEVEMMEKIETPTKQLNSFYNIGSRGNLRGKAKAGFIRPTVKELFTSSNYNQVRNEADCKFNTKVKPGAVITNEGRTVHFDGIGRAHAEPVIKGEKVYFEIQKNTSQGFAGISIDDDETYIGSYSGDYKYVSTGQVSILGFRLDFITGNMHVYENNVFYNTYTFDTSKTWYITIAGTGSVHTVTGTVATKTEDLQYEIPTGYTTIIK